MKKIPLLGLFLFWCTGLFAQECANQRYYDEIFNSVNVTSDVKFGENAQPTLTDPNNVQELFLDVYQPNGDDLSARPLIIWAFGGAFIFGSKTSIDIVALSHAFASRGYVCAAIDYRLSTDLIVNGEDSNVYEATLKATHDMLASIRFFYKDAATNNEFKIDTSRIYIGGVSSGAITALQVAHFDELNEVPMEIDSLFIASGGFEGTSGNPGYSHEVAGVISLCGAVLDTAWINPEIKTPIVSMHGTEDEVVPYGSDTLTLLDIAIEVDGSSSIHHKLNQDEIENDFYSFWGAGHTPFVGNQAYMDTTIWFVRDFLYDLVCDGVTSLDEISNSENLSFEVFPNPSNGSFNVRLDADEYFSFTVIDQVGQKVYYHPALPKGLTALELSLPPGLYTMLAYADRKQQLLSQKIIIIE